MLAQHVLVVRSYFELLEAKRLRGVTEQTIRLQRQQLANANSRFESGRLTKNELLVVQVAVLDADQRLVQDDLAIARARWALNEAVGLPVDAPTEVVDVDQPPEVLPVDEALRDAYAHNPALGALVEEQQRLEEAMRALVRGRLPRVSGGGSLDYTTSDIVQPQDVASGFVGFTWDLGTDTRREAQIAEARAGVERNRVEIERELRELERTVRLTHRALEERLAALAAAEAGVGQAEENLRNRVQQFDAGRATSDDVLDAEAILASQRASLASALYQAQTRRAELQQLIGLPLDVAAWDGK
jgi:outer membrane protein TolC